MLKVFLKGKTSKEKMSHEKKINLDLKLDVIKCGQRVSQLWQCCKFKNAFQFLINGRYQSRCSGLDGFTTLSGTSRTIVYDGSPECKITVQGGGSGTGLSQVAQGSVTIGNSDIFAEQEAGLDATKLKDHQVAVVGMAPVVNQDVGVKNVTMSQLRDIFTGKITNWQTLGGKNEKITVVNRAAGSGTRATFEAAVMNGQKAMTTQEQDSNGTVQKIVAGTPGAISYLAFSYVKADVPALSVDGVKQLLPMCKPTNGRSGLMSTCTPKARLMPAPKRS